MITRTLLAAAMLLLPACATTSEITRPIGFLTDCANSGGLRDAACFPTQMYFTDEQARKDHTLMLKGDALRAPRGYRATVIEVDGRLDNGPVGSRQFVVWANSNLPCDSDGGVAYRGQSKDDRAVVETETGLFEITDPSVIVGDQGGRVLIDARSGKIVSTLIEPNGGEGNFEFASATEIYLGIWGRGLCLTAPGPGRGLMQLAPDHCDDLPQTGATSAKILENDAGLDPPSDQDVTTAALALPEDAAYWKEFWRLKVGRIRGTQTIVVAPYPVCT